MKLSGRLDSASTPKLWRETTAVLEKQASSRVEIEAEQVEYCDGAGLGLLLDLARRQRDLGGELVVRGLKPEFRKLLDMFDPADFDPSKRKKKRPAPMPEEVGRAVLAYVEDLVSLVAFVGELLLALLQGLRHPRALRWGDLLYAAETAGVNALPIIALISFLVGLIMSFQAAVPMRQFGAEIFVANLIGLAMLRELGPLMTAIVLAGRSGAAFAAELGTMKVSEEIDAMTTMGLAPVQFLVVTRVLAAMTMTPLLTVFANLVGLVGGAIVLLSLGYPLVTYVNQVLGAVTYVDLLGGLFKSLVFGLIIAGIGCYRGLRTGSGASAVGESTTRAVVSGIVLIVLTDGLFSIAFFYLGI